MNAKILTCLILLTTTSSIAQQSSPRDIFPLRVGNSWRYAFTASMGTSGETIRDTGKHNYRILSVNHANDSVYWHFIANRNFVRHVFTNPGGHSMFTIVDSSYFDVVESDSGGHSVYSTATNEFSLFALTVCFLPRLLRYTTDTAQSITLTRNFSGVCQGTHTYQASLLLRPDTGIVTVQSHWAYLTYAKNMNYRLESDGMTNAPPLVMQPSNYFLSQNYPNPFNPTTNIEFQIPRRELVTLRVFDLLGREVETLVNEVMEPGRYERVFNAEGLASGVYLYQLRSGSFVQTRKLLLLR